MEIARLTTSNEEYNSSNLALQKQIDQLIDEEKESQQLIKSLKEQVQSLKSKLIDPSDYEQWDTQDIIAWILNLENGRFNKYKAKLEKTLIEENVKGEHLESVDVADIKGWGVVDFGDKKSLMKWIKALVNANNNEAIVSTVTDHEGAVSG